MSEPASSGDPTGEKSEERGEREERERRSFSNGERLIKREVRRPHPHYPEARHMQRFVKFIRALSDGLRLQSDSRVTVGHGVAMHPEGNLFFPLLASGVVQCLCVYATCCFTPAEAHYIGLMLMAAAGYDPRLVPHVHQKLYHQDYDKYYLDTTHPSAGRIVEMVSQDTVMDRAVKIYEQVQAGHEIPSFIEQSKIIPCSPIFSPFSVKQLFSPHVDGSIKLSW
ncbi:peptidase family M48 family protein [Striga asiatica]|uniref:Peptidase family M48 family protein n=1 Tax=Striga asiatica TaxID=4170 RepID=A0A5A7NXS1_STRAF|nr:peptidase family M48 family protein [Striga asiatica]